MYIDECVSACSRRIREPANSIECIFSKNDEQIPRKGSATCNKIVRFFVLQHSTGKTMEVASSRSHYADSSKQNGAGPASTRIPSDSSSHKSSLSRHQQSNSPPNTPNKHVNFNGGQTTEEKKREKFLTAKYGAHQMALIRKRLRVEMWMYERLQELYGAVRSHSFLPLDLRLIHYLISG